MLWCPKCGTEYRDGFKTCNDCNSELVDKPEYPAEETEPQYDKEAFLISVGNNFEADMFEALLNDNHIPVLKKYREAGDYLKIYMGGTNFGVDLYVPSKLLSKAQEIVANIQEAPEAEEPQDGEPELQDDGQQYVDDAQPDEELQSVEKGSQPYEESQPDEGSQNAEKEDTAGIKDSYSRKRRIRTWIILLFFIPGLTGLIWIIFVLINNLRQ